MYNKIENVIRLKPYLSNGSLTAFLTDTLFEIRKELFSTVVISG
jgi:hypothetical protein